MRYSKWKCGKTLELLKNLTYVYPFIRFDIMNIKTIASQILVLIVFNGCGGDKKLSRKSLSKKDSIEKIIIQKPAQLDLKQANNLVELPLACMQVEYPNKLGQTLGEQE